MKILAITRIIKDGLTDFRRSFWLSAAATAVMAITLFVISSLVILRSLTVISLNSIQDKVDISVYFELTTNEQTINQIRRQVELLPEVKSIDYIPPVEARERFKELHQNEPLLLESVEQFEDDENPFPASFAIRVNKLEDYPIIISLFEEEKFEPFVKRIADKQNVVERLNNLINNINNAGLLITLVFSFVTVVVMFNTVRLTIYNRREEIEIMKLVGATNSYIRGPFLVGGIIYALAGTIISSVVLFPLLAALSGKLGAFLGISSGFINLLGFNVWWLLAFQAVFGVVLGIVSSLFAIRRYLTI